MYNTLKTELADYLGIAKDALHIHFGLIIFTVLVLVLRKPTSLIPWLVVFIFEIANEIFDLFHANFHVAAFDTVKDLVNTMLWPSVALAIFRIYDRMKGPPCS